MNETMKKALAKAIRNFYTPEEILDEATCYEAAQEFVYEHDLDIKEYLRDKIDFADEFEAVLDEIDWCDIW